MNGRFKRLLEPGERILVRSTDGGATWYLAGAFILLAGLILVPTLWGAEFFGFRFWIVPLVFMISAPLVMAGAWLSTRWKWVITDRRVLKRDGMSSPGIAEMRHENVQEVRLRDKALSVHGRDCRWEFEVTRGFCRADILYDLFGARLGDPGLPARPLQEMLEPGETVPWRGIPLVTDLLPWVILFSGPLAVAVRLAWPEYSRDGPNTVMIFYLGFLGDAVAFWRRRGWQTAITNRRLLRRRPEAPSRCDIIPLDMVAEASWNRWNWMLVIVSPGRRDTIFCLPWTARRILATLESNDRGEALA